MKLNGITADPYIFYETNLSGIGFYIIFMVGNSQIKLMSVVSMRTAYNRVIN